jgi:hypothetical protein
MNTPLRPEAEPADQHIDVDGTTLLSEFHRLPAIGLQTAAHTSRWRRPRVCAIVVGVLLALLGPPILLLLGLYFGGVVPVCAVAGLIVLVVRDDRYQTQVQQQRYALALTLAVRDDARAFGPLAELWTPPGSRTTRPEQHIVNAELARLMAGYLAGSLTDGPDFSARQCMRDRLASTYYTRGGWRTPPEADLPDRETDLLLGLFQFMARCPEPGDHKILQRVAARPAPTPNRLLIREAAEVFLADSDRPVKRCKQGPY